MENQTNPPSPDIAPAGDDSPKAPPPLTRLRTYKDDIADAVKGNNMSAAKIFLAEEERRQQRQRVEEATSPETPKNRVMLFASILLVLAAVSGIVFLRFFYRAPDPVVQRVEVPLFIRADRLVEVPATERSYRDVQADLQTATRAPVPSREVHQVALTEARELGEDGKSARQIESSKFFGAIGAYPPGELTRSLNPDFFLGVYGGVKGPLPFIIFETSSPALARSAMLAWEGNMDVDLSSIFSEAAEYARVTGNQPSLRVKWQDAVYQNRDARVLSVNDEEVLLWGFTEGGAIIIASDPFLLPEMSSRLARDRELH